MFRIRRLLLLAAAVLPALAGGCNPLTLGLWTPVPVQPWVAERMQAKYEHKNDGRVPIMPPLRPLAPLPQMFASSRVTETEGSSSLMRSAVQSPV